MRSRPGASSMSCCATRFGRCFITLASRVEPRCATSCADSARSRSACARFTSSWLRFDAGFVLAPCRPAVRESPGPRAAGRRCTRSPTSTLIAFDVAGDLGVHVDFLVRPELGRQRQRLRQVAAHDFGDRRPLAARRRPPRRARPRARQRRSSAGNTIAQPPDRSPSFFVIPGPSPASRSPSIENPAESTERDDMFFLRVHRSMASGICATSDRRHRQQAAGVAKQHVARRHRPDRRPPPARRSRRCARTRATPPGRDANS